MNTNKCKNCGYTVDKLYCSKCGQKDSELLKFKSLIKDFFNDYLDLDSRFFLTFKYLITKPGLLTAEYWQGRKSRYLSPIRIYLITSILFVLFTSLSSDNPKENSHIDVSNTEQGILESDLSVYGLAWSATKNNIDFLFAEQSENLQLFLFLPFFALGLKISNRKLKHLYLTHYLIGSIHISSAFYLLEVIIIIFNALLPNYEFLIEYFISIKFLYAILAIKHIFNISLIKSIIKTMIFGVSAFLSGILAIISLLIIVFSSRIIFYYILLM